MLIKEAGRKIVLFIPVFSIYAQVRHKNTSKIGKDQLAFSAYTSQRPTIHTKYKSV
jgi:hypothetical protein